MKLGVAFAVGSLGVWELGCGKWLVRSLGRGNEQDARFTMLRDSETPHSESNRRSDAGRTLQERAVTPRNLDIGMGDTPELDSVLAIDGLSGVLLQCNNRGCGNCGLTSSK